MGVLVVHVVVDIEPDVTANMIVFFACEWAQAVPQSCRLKNVAPQNMPYMSFTLDTSQFDKSSLNDVVPKKIPLMSFTFDTSYFERLSLKNFT